MYLNSWICYCLLRLLQIVLFIFVLLQMGNGSVVSFTGHLLCILLAITRQDKTKIRKGKICWCRRPGWKFNDILLIPVILLLKIVNLYKTHINLHRDLVRKTNVVFVAKNEEQLKKSGILHLDNSTYLHFQQRTWCPHKLLKTFKDNKLKFLKRILAASNWLRKMCTPNLG